MARGEGGNRPLDIEIVGVVRDAKYDDIRATPPPQFFLPYRQSPLGPLTVYAHVAPASARAVMGAIRTIVARLDPNLPVTQLQTIEDQHHQNTGRERALSTLSGSFAGLAMLLAGIGLYGVLSYGVAQRRREMGIRMAIGAAPWQVRRLVFGHVSWMTLVGGGFGCVAAIGLARVSRSLLFGVEGLDLRVLAGAAGLVLATTLLVGAVPARRAAAVNPAEALRAQ
jgi:ABC-type antimicrobial peptide transport system permease subunit